MILGTSRGEGNSYNSLNIPMSQNKKPKGRFEGTGHTIIKTNESYFKWFIISFFLLINLFLP